ncbi:unnamed protein product [Eruca vesicaria subsp. sativa]|uniref:Uncharacterized protein n=1 Tax=Eruca vesicaria subsp. sativa TaxID=29727 RepID=A0ABC8LMW1_ERUVS|nr:unnamed protein product [Eruca vesicaria subsp. sativa]
MDPEARDEKARKEYYRKLDFFSNAQQGIPKLCPCGSITKLIVDEDDTYDYLPGKRYFICKDFENDGMHFRQPWVMGMQEEVERLKERFDEQEKVLKECQALKMRVSNSNYSFTIGLVLIFLCFLFRTRSGCCCGVWLSSREPA